MVRIGGGSTKLELSDRWIVYTKSRKQLLHRGGGGVNPVSPKKEPLFFSGAYKKCSVMI